MRLCRFLQKHICSVKPKDCMGRRSIPPLFLLGWKNFRGSSAGEFTWSIWKGHASSPASWQTTWILPAVICSWGQECQLPMFSMFVHLFRSFLNATAECCAKVDAENPGPRQQLARTTLAVLRPAVSGLDMALWLSLSILWLKSGTPGPSKEGRAEFLRPSWCHRLDLKSLEVTSRRVKHTQIFRCPLVPWNQSEEMSKSQWHGSSLPFARPWLRCLLKAQKVHFNYTTLAAVLRFHDVSSHKHTLGFKPCELPIHQMEAFANSLLQCLWQDFTSTWMSR